MQPKLKSILGKNFRIKQNLIDCCKANVLKSSNVSVSIIYCLYSVGINFSSLFDHYPSHNQTLTKLVTMTTSRL